MSLFKRGNVWWIDVAANGRRLRQSAETSHRAAAQELHDQLKAALWRQKHLNEAAPRSLDEAAEKWLGEKADARALRDYEHHLKWWCERAAGLELTEITRQWVHQQLDGLKARKGKEQRPASAGTKNNYLVTLRSVLNTARDEWEWLEQVPTFRTYGEGKRATMRMCIATPEQAKGLVAVLPPALQAPVAFAFMTGLRKSNVFGLKWSQVDLPRSVAWVTPDETKAGNLIVVPLNTQARAIIESQVRADGEERVFPVEPPCNTQWKRYTARAGMPTGFRFHDIRHTFASWHAMAGTERKTLQDLGGWQSNQMVDRYVHLPTAHLVTAAERLSVNLN